MCLFRKLQPTDDPLRPKFELSVGDATLDLPDDEIRELIGLLFRG